MQALLLGFLALAAGLLGLRVTQQAGTAVSPKVVRMMGGALAAGLAIFLLMRGSTALGAILTLLASTLLLGGALPGLGTSGAPSPDPAKTTKIVTETLQASLDHATGAIEGRVLRGFFQGRSLESLKPVELAHLWSDCRFADPQSAQILEAYLDRIHPAWRDDMARTDGAATGDPGHSGSGSAAGRTQAMSRRDALEILGLGPAATEAEVRSAHRELMLKLHPDRGGSHTLAAKVNEAKEILLGKT